ncbi:MAG: SusC/RagA family TonB-linked outer membrane protein [Ginsengibacter sp.]
MKENFLLLSIVFFAGSLFASPTNGLHEESRKSNLTSDQIASVKILKKITGSISAGDGTPLPGASVTARTSGKAVVSDEKGHYSIEVDDKESVLVFSFSGMRTQEVTIKNRSIINVELQLVAHQLTDVIITGMQRREKNKMIGSISTVTAQEIENAGVTTIDKALKGKMAGVYVRSNSGRPGEVGEIIIHGINTMTGNKEPLYVLDGMPMQSGEVSGGVNSLLTNGLGNIPPDDIESISILKDATAASIYGARAANGVIIITTKQGVAGKDYVSYTGKAGITFRPENKFSFMNSAEKLEFERGIYEDYHPVYGGRVNQLLYQADNGVITHANAEAQIAELGKTNTDWIKELYRPAMTQSHNISLSGGNLKTQYNVSLNYQNSEGTLIGNKYQMGGLNMKLSRYITDKFLVRVNLYSTLKSNEEGQSLLDPFRYAVFANPYERPYNEDGSYASDLTYRNLNNDITYTSDLNYKQFNILRELRENTLKSFYGNVRGQFGVEYSFLRNFRYNGTAVVDYTSIHNQDESREGTYRSWALNWLNAASTQSGMIKPEFNQGFLREDMGRTMNYTVRNSIEYNQNLGKSFVQIFGANEIGGRTNNQFNHFNPVYLQDYRVTGYPSWNFITADRYNKLDLSRFGGTKFAEDRSVSFIGSGVYSYDNRYVFNANIRTDGVDIIGTQNQFAPLWSAGLRWNAHNETFMKPYSDVLSRLVFSA